MSDRALNWGTQPIYLGIEFLLPVKQFAALRLLKRGDEARALIALVADPAESSRHDICGFCLGEGCHVVIMPGNGLGYEEEVAPEIRDGLTVKAGCLMFSRPQFWCIAPGPGRCQEAVYQHRLLAGDGFFRFLRGRPVLFGGRSMSGVNFAMIPEITGCDVSKISAQTSWMMFCRMYPLATTTASRRERSFGRPILLRHGSSSCSSMRHTSSSSCSGQALTYDRTATASPIRERCVSTSFLSGGEAVVC